MTPSLICAIIPLHVSFDVNTTLSALGTTLRTLSPGTLAVAPEGTLSGYENTPDLIDRLTPETTENAISAAQDLVDQTGVILIIGGCVLEAGLWRNRSYLMQPNRPALHYDKINLAVSEQGVFTPGDQLPVFNLTGSSGKVRIGIQMCREIRYPEQWRTLAQKGAQIIAYPNNAIDSSTGDAVWRAHMISRAAETQRFVLSANAISQTQLCPSAIISPKGEVLKEVRGQQTKLQTAEIDLDEVSNWVLDQARSDLVQVVETGRH